jgi:hypothetical protein
MDHRDHQAPDRSGQPAPRLTPPARFEPWPHVDLPHLPLTHSHPDGYLWKRDHVATHARRQPLAWIDDDFTPADHHWASARTAAGRPTLLIQPDPYTGIQPEHTEAVRQWALTLELPRSA